MTALPKTMRAVVCATPGPISVLKLQDVPIPTPGPGQVLIKILGFGINRAEMYTRQGLSPITFPRIIGIECVGTVAGYGQLSSPPEPPFALGSRVATCMGGLGRETPGSYAEYTCTAVENVRAVPAVTPPSKLSVAQLAAMPEMLQTTWGALTAGLDLRPGDSLLVRGATSSIGLCALSLARRLGATRVAGTTRSPARETMLRDAGADDVFIEPKPAAAATEGKGKSQTGGGMSAEVRRRTDGKGYTKVLELTGATTLLDSVRCASEGGTVCVVGMQGGAWELRGNAFSPSTDLPGRVRLCAYGGGPADFRRLPWDELVLDAAAGRLRLPPVRAFRLEQIQEVHEIMEAGGGGAKMAVVVDEDE